MPDTITTPPCPDWCSAQEQHGFEPLIGRAELIRDHDVSEGICFYPDLEAGSSHQVWMWPVVRQSCVPGEPVKTDSMFVRLATDEWTAVTPAEARRMAVALAQMADLLDDIARKGN